MSDYERVCNCKLSSNHFEIMINEGHPPIMMSSIIEIKPIMIPSADGNINYFFPPLLMLLQELVIN